jgi:CRP-like cAMP-binding protein
MGIEQIEALCAVLGPSFTRREAEELLGATELQHVPALGVILREGDPGAGLHFLVGGRVEVLKTRRDGAGQRLAVVEAPSLLGELSLLLHGAHTATARAVTDCDLRLLATAEFRRRLAAGDLLAYKLLGAMAEILARRLTRINETVLELSAGPVAGARMEELERFKQRLFSEWTF